MTTITSTDNPRFRDLAKLQQSGRERRKSGLAVLEGVHLVEAYHQQRGLPELLIVNAKRRHEAEIEALLIALALLEALEFSAKLFARLSSVDRFPRASARPRQGTGPQHDPRTTRPLRHPRGHTGPRQPRLDTALNSGCRLARGVFVTRLYRYLVAARAQGRHGCSLPARHP